MDNNRDEVLPKLKEGQSFNCVNGCGECKAIEFDFVYGETFDGVTGEILEQLTYKAYKSSCCGGDIEIWDDNIGDAIPWQSGR